VIGFSLFVFRGRISRAKKLIDDGIIAMVSSISTKLVQLELTVKPLSESTTSTGRPTTETTQMEITVTSSIPVVKFFWPFVRNPVIGSVVKVISGKSGVEPYAKLDEEPSGSKFRDDFDSVRKILQRFSFDVAITLPEGPVNGLCWESLMSRGGIIGELAPEESAYKYLPFNCYRKLSSTRRRASSRIREITILALAEDNLGRSLASAAWNPLEKSRRISFELKDGNEVFSRNPRPEVSVIHLIGSLESSYLGVGMRFGEEYFTVASQSSESLSERDSLVRVEDVTRTFPNLSVCVIQGEPRQANPQRLDGDRRDAFFARLFASQMFATGVPFVLVIPPLRITEATAVVEQLARALAGWPLFKQERLLKTVGDLRLQIGRYALSLGLDPVATQELPQDLCLYVTHDWDGRLT
jgi:hypothetical protein